MWTQLRLGLVSLHVYYFSDRTTWGRRIGRNRAICLLLVCISQFTANCSQLHHYLTHVVTHFTLGTSAIVGKGAAENSELMLTRVICNARGSLYQNTSIAGGNQRRPKASS